MIEEKLFLMTQMPSVSGRLLFKIVGVVARRRENNPPPPPKKYVLNY